MAVLRVAHYVTVTVDYGCSEGIRIFEGLCWALFGNAESKKGDSQRRGKETAARAPAVVHGNCYCYSVVILWLFCCISTGLASRVALAFHTKAEPRLRLICCGEVSCSNPVQFTLNSPGWRELVAEITENNGSVSEKDHEGASVASANVKAYPRPKRCAQSAC